VVQAPAPSRPIERSIAGSGLLAHVLTAKFCDHLSDCHRFHNIHNKRVQTHPTKVKTAKPPRLRLAQVEHENHHRKEGDEVRHHPSEAVPFLR
jgi:transposase